jgi:hypothetical protein
VFWGSRLRLHRHRAADEAIRCVPQALEYLVRFDGVRLRSARKGSPLTLGASSAWSPGRERRAPSILRTGRHLDPESTAELLAATITHEATDARIRSRGIRSAHLPFTAEL